MKRAIILCFLLISSLVQIYPQRDGDSIVIGKYRKFHSSVTNEDRTLLVWLPRTYNDSILSYPVLFLLYGQSTTVYLLPTITACDMLAESGKIPEMIIVGVASAERYRDYSSIADGYIENTVKFFRDELFPFVERNYRTTDYRIVIGPQAGAVFSFYALMKHPDLFQAYVLENPFTWQIMEILDTMAVNTFRADKILNRFLFVREEMNHRPESVETVNRFAEWMKSNSPEGFRFHYSLEEPSGYFVSPVPAKEALLLLFEPYAFPSDLKVDKVEDIREFYRKAGKLFGTEFTVPEHVLTMESDKLMTAGKYSEQAALLEYMLSVYPRSLNALLRFGDLKRTLGEYEEAILYYDEFLRIMPVDAIAIRNRRNNLEKYVNESLVYVLEKDIQSLGVDKAIKKFHKQKASKENKRTCTENEFNSLGYALLNRGKMEESIRIFTLAIEIYPESANLYDSLGEACMTKKENANAIKYYKKSLELNPQNDNARKRIDQLRNNQ
jgi:hypothetical protein